MALTLGPAAITHAQSPQPRAFNFDWTSTTNVGLWPQDRTIVPVRPGDRVLRGTGILTVVAGRSPNTSFEFDFRGPNGIGSGLVLPDQRTLDPNFAFPSVAVTEPPARLPRRLQATFRLIGPTGSPSAVEVRFIEIFICRGTPESCGGVHHLERIFIGIGRPAPGG